MCVCVSVECCHGYEWNEASHSSAIIFLVDLQVDLSFAPMFHTNGFLVSIQCLSNCLKNIDFGKKNDTMQKHISREA